MTADQALRYASGATDGGQVDQLDARAFTAWVARGRRTLEAHREELDRINVFPVADADTGTNMCLTWRAVDRAVSGSPDPVDPVDPVGALGALTRAAATAALTSARGNSGAILAQVMRGLAATWVGGTASAADLASALGRAAQEAAAAVAEPVEGTVLTVLAAAAAGASAAADLAGADLVATALGAATRAAEAVRNTQQQHPALAAAGVVDAGGRGMALLLEALHATLAGRPEGTAAGPASPDDPAGPDDPEAAAQRPRRPAVGGTPAYEVTYLLEASASAVGRLREALLLFGDSLVVAGGEGLWNVHVHVDDVAAAIEAGLDAGRPSRLTVVRFADHPDHVEPSPEPDQLAARPVDEEPWDDHGGVDPDPFAPHTGAAPAQAPHVVRAVVAVADGGGTATLFTDLGARVVAGPLPSESDLVRAIEATRADEVVVLPGDPRLAAVVQAAAEATRGEHRTVAVVPTRSPLQGLVALAVADPGRRFADDVIAMAQATGACRCGGVSLQGGRVVASLDGSRGMTAPDLTSATLALALQLRALGGEILTVLLGRDAPPGVAARLRSEHPDLSVEVLDGGQTDPVVVLGIE